MTIIFALSAQPARAAGFDGSEPLICAVQEVQSCFPGSPCVRSLPQQVGAPEFIHVNFRKKEIRGPKRSTPIRLQAREDGNLILHGTELGFGWSIALDTETGGFSANLIDSSGAHALFGICTVQE